MIIPLIFSWTSLKSMFLAPKNSFLSFFYKFSSQNSWLKSFFGAIFWSYLLILPFKLLKEEKNVEINDFRAEKMMNYQYFLPKDPKI